MMALALAIPFRLIFRTGDPLANAVEATDGTVIQATDGQIIFAQ